METLKVRGKLLLVVVSAFIVALALSGCFLLPAKKTTNVNPNVGLEGPSIIIVDKYLQNGQTVWIGYLKNKRNGMINGKITSTNGVKREVDISLKNLDNNVTVVSSTVKVNDNNEFFFDLGEYASKITEGNYEISITAYDKYGNPNTKTLNVKFTDVKISVVAATNTANVVFMSVLPKNDYDFTVDGNEYTLTNAGTIAAITVNNLQKGVHTVILSSNNGSNESVMYNFITPASAIKNESGIFLDNNNNHYYSRNGDSAVIVYFKTSTPIVGYYYTVSIDHYYTDFFKNGSSGEFHYVKLSFPSVMGALRFTYPEYNLNVRYCLKVYTVDENGNIGTIYGSNEEVPGPYTDFTLYSAVDSYASLQTSAEYNAVKAGSNVTVSVNVKNLEDLMGMNVEVTSSIFDSTPTVSANSLGCSSYNKEIMSVISKTATDVKAMIGYADVPGKSVEHFTANGNILTITWKVPSNTKPGIYPVYMSTPKFVNQKDEPIDGVHVEAVSYILVK